MKKIFLSVAMMAFTIGFAQKKEIVAAVKAIDAGDVAGTKTQLAAAESAMNGQTWLVEPTVLEQYYYAKGLSLLKEGKTSEGASYLAKMNDLKDIYTGKDANKNRVYYAGKEAADKSGVQNLKLEKYTPSLVSKLSATINPLIENANKTAVTNYNEKKYAVAAPAFKQVYDLLKAAGEDKKQYLYYAGINYAMAEKRPEAIAIYNELINSGFTGVETTYTGKNKKTGEVQAMAKTEWDLYKKMGAASDFEDFKIETSKSVEQELYETNVALLLEDGQYDAALEMVDRGLKKFPKSEKLTDLQGTVNYKAGKMDAFLASLKAQIAQNPNNANAWYNLAVVQSKDPATVADAATSYKKAVELKPDYDDAWQNLTYLTMGDDSKAIDDFNAAKKAGKTELANKIINDRRGRLAAALPYAEKWYQADPNSLDAVKLLKGLYQSTKNDAKFQEFKAKEAAMQGK